MNEYGYIKVAAAVPRVRVADCSYNAAAIVQAARHAAAAGVEAAVFPELSVTGYTAADLLLQTTLQEAACDALECIADETRALPTVLIVGLPVAWGDRLYNCAAVLCRGEILGVVPKQHIPNYAEFYEGRWFASGEGITGRALSLSRQIVPFGIDLIFDINGVRCGIELCEDLWVPAPPSTELAAAGAEVVFNLSASPESVGKHDYLEQLVAQQSARTRTGYVYVSAGFGESSTDLVFAGSALIADQGAIVARGERFSTEPQVVVTDIDIEQLRFERRRMTTFHTPVAMEYRTVECRFTPVEAEIERTVDPMPFVPSDDAQRESRCEEILAMQSLGLAQRLVHTRCRKAVVGISGGLDSTLALLVTVGAFDRLGYDRSGVVGITMPGFGTTGRTHDNALKLMELLGVTSREIPIVDACRQHLRDIGLSEDDRSAAYENAQARERTQILMDVANMEGGLVVGTGDLSELALGWATYNGDQMSMYGVNASVPKTLVRHLVHYRAMHEQEAVREVLMDVLDTPVSPELLPAAEDGTIAQKTEDLVGPYELHDFFLYHAVRRGARPAKVLLLAGKAFGERYSREVILHWMQVFFRRFFAQQFKRSAMPDGVKVGSVSLSPRGDWRMPSDASAAVWLCELDNL